MLRTTFLNEGPDSIEIDTNQRWSTVSFSALIDTTEMKLRREEFGSYSHAMGEPPKPKFMKVRRGEFYSVESKVSLMDTFFVKDGYYRMKVDSSIASRAGGHIASSGDIIFKLESCD